MFTSLFILSLTARIGVGLECTGHCFSTKIPFDEAPRIHAGQCKQSVTQPACTVDITLDFHKMQYSATFESPPGEYKTIRISPGEFLEHGFGQECSTDVDGPAHRIVHRVFQSIQHYGWLSTRSNAEDRLPSNRTTSALTGLCVKYL